MVLCREVAGVEVPIEHGAEVVCYPTPWHPHCRSRLSRLRELGVTALISYGKHQVGEVKIVGKGHAAVVVLAKHQDHGLVAVKIRRMDSKRLSLEPEGELLKLAEETGFVPKVYAFDKDFVIREYVDGPTLKEYIEVANRCELRKLFASIARGFAKMDLMGVDVEEVSKPLTQIVVECGNPLAPKLVDLESARRSQKASSLTRFLGFLARYVKGVPVYEILGLGSSDFARIRELANRYKRALGSEKREIAEEIARIIEFGGSDEHGCI